MNGVRAALRSRKAFTLIELLVVVAIITVLISILLPALSAARQQAQAVKCLTNLRSLGQGIAIYAHSFKDRLPGGRLPKIDNCNTYADIVGGRKYRPTFVALMSESVGAPPFEDPKACATDVDKFGQMGDRQDYSYGVYVCPTVADWTDERNAAYGYNYQFLGNSRLFDTSDQNSYKNWPVSMSRVTQPSRTVAAGDCMGTAATYAENVRQPYENNGRVHDALGEEGFNLDPPWVDAANGEMAGLDDGLRTAVDPRHRSKRGNVVWVDGHAAPKTLAQLGYRVEADGSIPISGFTEQNVDNTQWSGTGENIPWTANAAP